MFMGPDPDPGPLGPPKWRTTLSFFWESIAKHPGERRYALDQRNINNAYVSGMKQALHLNGNEYNYPDPLFNCGYLVGSIPSQWSLSFARPSIMIPSCKVTYIYVCRFFQGVAESICFPTMMMIIGSWYKLEEIAKRVIIWDMTGNIASMFSGYLQAAIYTNLNVPDFPTTTRALWLIDRDKGYSIRRITEMTVKRFFQIFTAYITGAGTYMNLWLQAVGYDMLMTNILPTIGNTISLSEVFQDDPELRGYLPAIGNAIWYCQYAWFPVVAFPAQDAPHYRWGYWAALALTIVNIISIYTMYLASKWDVRRRGLVMNKYGLYVEREDLVDYSASSLGDTKGPKFLNSGTATLLSTKKE
ncbi:hypothetical protein V1506DRAFT_569275 [Lipomyces tetrasporus]